MGTNYYAKIDKCDCCGHAPDDVHIGKSSSGWTFLLHSDPGLKLTDLYSWQEFMMGKEIVDEYGNQVGFRGMLSIIMSRDGGPDSALPSNILKGDNCELGINNLLRPKVDGVHCIERGDGTWDMVIGEFS
ncbi:MAG: hypothetical protein KAS32_17540 [Candidatus Peribacteraceae bacterium]|nr:hypothetical protein [Candidatus Peribacteraceae bacterium]